MKFVPLYIFAFLVLTSTIAAQGLQDNGSHSLDTSSWQQFYIHQDNNSLVRSSNFSRYPMLSLPSNNKYYRRSIAMTTLFIALLASSIYTKKQGDEGLTTALQVGAVVSGGFSLYFTIKGKKSNKTLKD